MRTPSGRKAGIFQIEKDIIKNISKNLDGFLVILGVLEIFSYLLSPVKVCYALAADRLPPLFALNLA